MCFSNAQENIFLDLNCAPYHMNNHEEPHDQKPLIDTHRVKDKLQFAHQANRSTDDAIITLIHDIAQHVDGDSQYAR